MPERARIFTRCEAVARALAGTPALAGRVHRFGEVADLVLPPGGLFVARVPDEARQPGPGDGFAAARARFGWLDDVWPSAAWLGRLRALATSAHPLAYYHYLERGDHLYYAFGWLAGDGADLVVQQTSLVADDECTAVFRETGSTHPAPASAWDAVLAHLALASTIGFFRPEDELRESDWPPLD
jgi:hypothetical protein